MQSYIITQLPKNINCIASNPLYDSTIMLSTTTFLPSTYITTLPTLITRGKAQKRYIRTNFSIPASTPLNQLYSTAHQAYLQATKQLRISIAQHKLALQKAHLKTLKRI